MYVSIDTAVVEHHSGVLGTRACLAFRREATGKTEANSQNLKYSVSFCLWGTGDQWIPRPSALQAKTAAADLDMNDEARAGVVALHIIKKKNLNLKPQADKP